MPSSRNLRSSKNLRSKQRRLFLESLESRALMAVTPFTDQLPFLIALPGTPQTVDFDSLAVNTAIPSGGSVGGVTFTYALDHTAAGGPASVDLKVGSGFSTTSGANYLAADDAANFDLLADGDAISLSFSATQGVGLYVVTSDLMVDDDVTLTVGVNTVGLSAASGVAVGGGSFAYFLGLIDDTTTFTTATLNADSGAPVSFFFNIDDIITASEATLSVALDGSNNLVITDTFATGKNNSLSLSNDGAGNIVITNSTEQFSGTGGIVGAMRSKDRKSVV